MNRNAFTLIELSITLVIIGLIVGGVLVGQDLIRAAQIRSIVGENTQYKTAIYTFKNRFGDLPGDFPKAELIWPPNSQYTGFATCGGNGDGIISGAGMACPYGGGSGLCSSGNRENSRVFEHLAASGLIRSRPAPGPDGITGCSTTGKTGEISATIKNSSWVLRTKGEHAFQNDPNLNYLALGERGVDDDVLTPIEMRTLDLKLDDGIANAGNVRVNNTTGCITSYPNYNVNSSTSNDKACAPAFIFR